MGRSTNKPPAGSDVPADGVSPVHAMPGGVVVPEEDAPAAQPRSTKANALDCNDADPDCLRRKLRFLEALVDELPTPIFAKNDNARFCLFNKAYETFFNVDRCSLLGKTVLDLDYLPEADRIRYQREDLQAIRDGAEFHYETDCGTEWDPRQTLYWSKGFQVSDTGERGLVGTLVDISRLRRLEETLSRKIRRLEEVRKELYSLSRTDPLTGLYNRRFFEERAADYMKISDRHSLPLTLLMADLDFFKSVNDEFGHDAGDAVLKTFADLVRGACRGGDIVARIGGEEFALLLPMTEPNNALRLADRIRTVLRTRCRLPDGRGMTCSLGAARYRPPETLDDLLKRADMALYRAKHEGRDRVCLDESCSAAT